MVESKQQFTSPANQEEDDDQWILCGDKSGKNGKSVKQGKMAVPVKQQPSPVTPSKPAAAVAAPAAMEEETISLRKSLYYEVMNASFLSLVVN